MSKKILNVVTMTISEKTKVQIGSASFHSGWNKKTENVSILRLHVYLASEWTSNKYDKIICKEADIEITYVNTWL